MNFATSFLRYKGTVPSGGVALGADVAPTARPGPAIDNLATARFATTAGDSVAAVVVTWTGPANAAALLGTLYVWEEVSNTWHRVGEQTPMSANSMTRFVVPSLVDRPVSVPGKSTSSGGLEAVLLVEVPPGVTAPNGTYNFFMAVASGAGAAESLPTIAANQFLPPRKVGEAYGAVGVITTGAAAETNLGAVIGAGRRYVTFAAMTSDVFVAFKAATSVASVSATTGFPIPAGDEKSWWIDASSFFLETFSAAPGTLHWYESSPTYEA